MGSSEFQIGPRILKIADEGKQGVGREQQFLLNTKRGIRNKSEHSNHEIRLHE